MTEQEQDKPHWKRIEEALQRSKDACAKLTAFIRQHQCESKCSPTVRMIMDGMRREWGRLYDEYARIRDDPNAFRSGWL